MPNNTLMAERRASLEWAIEAAVTCGYTSDADVLRGLLAELSAAHPGQPEPIAWESTTVAYTKYITDERYQKFSPEVRKWYKPYRCSACSEPRAEVALFADNTERDKFIHACQDFDDDGETDIDYGLLMKWAVAGLLDCDHFTITKKGRAAIDAARKGEPQ